MRAVASLLVWAAWTVLVILWTPVVAISLAFTGWWDRSRWIAGRVFRFGARLLVALNPFWSVRLEGRVPAFRIPFLGLMMRMAGDVSVRREDRTSRSASLTAMGRWLARGSSVMIFPEGTRSRTEEMLPFRDGAFRLAIETGRPVQPLAVNGTRTAIRKGSLLFGTARVVVRILEPVPTEGLGPGDVEELRLRVRQRIEDAR